MGDTRRNKRLIKLMDSLSSSPTKSIPQACQGWNETKAAYRLLANPDLEWREILDVHTTKTVERGQDESVILCLQDTSELDFSSKPGVAGMGRLNYDARQGMYIHPTLMTTPEGKMLGVTDAWMWARPPKGEAQFCESERWIEGYQRVAEQAADFPDSRLVYIGDRESDMIELMKAAKAADYAADFLIRSQHNRLLAGSKLKCWDQVATNESLGDVEFILPASEKRKARKVCQTLYSQRVTLAGKEPIEVTAILAIEENPPKGEEPICWKLLTNREVTTFDSSVELVQWYRRRWQIEIFFRVLKSGCQAEAMQLGGIDRVERLLVIYLIIAWRILVLVYWGRECPDLPCEVVFDKEEWETAWAVTQRSKPPEEQPSLGAVVRMVAKIGGFLNRKSDGEPGAKSIWEGLQKVRDYAYGIEVARQLQL